MYKGESEKQIQITAFYEAIGLNIKKGRTSCKYTQESLAEALGVSRVSMVNIESGKQRLPLHVINNLCGILNVSISDIVPLSSQEEKPTTSAPTAPEGEHVSVDKVGEEKEPETRYTIEDVDRAYCFGYLGNPKNNSLDNVELNHRYAFFKEHYLKPHAFPVLSSPVNTQDRELTEIFRWLLGYSDFPERKDGEGAYYWRTHLRAKLEKLGIDIK